jgi:hypothetical protein
MLKPRRPASSKRIPTTVSISREALEIIDAHADQLGVTRSAIVEELILSQLRPKKAPKEPLELMEGAIRSPVGTDPERDRKLKEAWVGWDQAEVEKEVAPWSPPQAKAEERKILPSAELFKIFSKAVTDADKPLPELRLTDVAALEEVFASAKMVAGESSLYVFECWTKAYVLDAETPTPSGLLMNLHKYISIRSFKDM